MEHSETGLRSNMQDTLLHNTDYFKYIFKKTEKIVCAVFYILRSDKSLTHDIIVRDLEETAQSILVSVLDSLRGATHTTEVKAGTLLIDLIGLASRLRMAHGARLISEETLTVFLNEIDTVQRSLRRYTDSSYSVNFKEEDRGTLSAPRVVRRRVTEGGGSEGGVAMVATDSSRRDRILAVIKDKIEPNIKDIVEVVTDCSEKTIQRELNSLIKDNIVHREGERRWSKYKLV